MERPPSVSAPVAGATSAALETGAVSVSEFLREEAMNTEIAAVPEGAVGAKFEPILRQGGGEQE